jgi:hypothetical protein
MSHNTLHSRVAVMPPALRPAMLRAGLLLAVAAALSAFAVRARAQVALVGGTGSQPVAAAVPFAVGEELVYHATLGGLPAGTARMRVEAIDTVRGRPAYHVVFAVDGGIPFFRVHDRYESWIDVETLSSLRHRQVISEGRYHRSTTYEIMPERCLYQKNDEEPRPSVANPVDDGSFIYAVRVAGIAAGETRRDDRYFVPDRNPVLLTGLREDTVTVGVGTFATTVVQPIIKAGGIFSKDGEARVWFSNDEHRIPVLVKSHFLRFSLTLSLTSVTYGVAAAP